MTTKAKSLAAGGAVIGGGSAAAGGIYISNNSNTIVLLELVKEDVIPEEGDFTEQWKQLSTSASAASETNMSSVFAGKEDKAKALKEWCHSQYKISVSKEQTQEEKDLINLVKKWCTYTIEKQLGADKVLKTETTGSNNDESNWKIKAWWLQEYEEPKTGTKEFDLTNGIDSIKTEVSKGESNWTHLRDWCKGTYKRGYKGEQDNLWKLANKFCKKPTIIEALKKTELPETAEVDTEWETKATSANTSAKDSSIKGKLAGNDKKDLIKKWCKDNYSKFVGDKIGETDDLLTEVKTLCSLTIKEKITNTNLITDESKWKEKVKALKTHAETKPTDLQLTEELQKIVTDNPTKDNDKGWESLKNWCTKTYEMGYKGDNNQLWKLADKFCKKS